MHIKMLFRYKRKNLIKDYLDYFASYLYNINKFVIVDSIMTLKSLHLFLCNIMLNGSKIN